MSTATPTRPRTETETTPRPTAPAPVPTEGVPRSPAGGPGRRTRRAARYGIPAVLLAIAIAVVAGITLGSDPVETEVPLQQGFTPGLADGWFRPDAPLDAPAPAEPALPDYWGYPVDPVDPAVESAPGLPPYWGYPVDPVPTTPTYPHGQVR